MKHVLIVSPHFPPDARAASHRMRLLAPRLPEHGWEPTVVTVDPRDIGARPEPELERFVHGRLRLERIRAPGGNSGRWFGVGDLGLRAMKPLYGRCSQLLRDEHYDAILLTLPPHYIAMLGPMLRKASGVPYVLDYQDPWVSAWGMIVGSGHGGRPDWKSRLSRRLALGLEPHAVRYVSGLTAVSEGTLKGLLDRHPGLRTIPRAEVPIGGEPRDFVLAREGFRPNRFFDPSDGRVHLVYVGTLPPVGGKTVLGAFLAGVALLLTRAPQLRSVLRIHFLGMSMQTSGNPLPLAFLLAQEAGVDECVDEHPLRIDYLDALTALSQAGVVLLLGGTEPHYTASRVYPALLTRNPLLAVYHEASTVCEVLRLHGPAGLTQLITFGERPGTVAGAIANGLSALTSSATRDRDRNAIADLGSWNASALAGRMADCLSAAVVAAREAPSSRG